MQVVILSSLPSFLALFFVGQIIMVWWMFLVLCGWMICFVVVNLLVYWRTVFGSSVVTIWCFALSGMSVAWWLSCLSGLWHTWAQQQLAGEKEASQIPTAEKSSAEATFSQTHKYYTTQSLWHSVEKVFCRKFHRQTFVWGLAPGLFRQMECCVFELVFTDC